MSRQSARLGLLGLVTLGLAAGCASPPPIGELDAVTGFIGGVVAEEPQAAIVGRDVLSAGGSAADAAVAVYLALSVTYPIGAGLAGGGSCLVYDRGSAQAEALDFLPARAAAGGTVAIPGVVRGLAVLHARYGRLRWSQLVTPAETLARFGFPVSRALARAQREAPDAVRAALGTEGTLPAEGSLLTPVELSSVLSRLRRTGAADLYGGQLGRTFVEGAQPYGGRLSVDDLRTYVPAWQPVRRIAVSEATGYLPPAGSGPRIEQLWQALFARRSLLSTGGPPSTEALARVLDGTRPAPVAEGAAGRFSSGFVTVDRNGNAVACGTTMGRPFGIAQRISALGLWLAPPLPAADLALLLVANENTDNLLFAAAGAGAGASDVVVQSALNVLAGNTGLAAASSRPRIMAIGPAGEIVMEPAAFAIAAGALNGAGLRPRQGAISARLSAIHCPDGLPRKAESCQFVADNRGFGIAAIGGF